jgi:prepilin-type processing-associated H-X9-DG protein
MAPKQYLRPQNRPNGGFSYIELLVSLAIIVILYAVFLGPSSRQMQEKRKAECSHQLQQIYLSITAYAADHDGAYPSVRGAMSPSQPLSLLVPKYTSDTSIFICPGSGDSALPGGQPFENRRISYAYYMGLHSDAGVQAPVLSDAQISSTPKRKGDPLFATAKNEHPGNNHRTFGGNVIFADGHVETTDGLAPVDLPVPFGGTLLNPK